MNKSIKVKLRKIGNSIGCILPSVITKGYNIGDEIVITVITVGDVITPKDTIEQLTYAEDIKVDEEGNIVEVPVIGTIDSETEVVTYTQPKFNTEMCQKHKGSIKGTCGCK